MFWNKSSKEEPIKKKFCLIGWYGQRAHGDDIMEITTKRLFEDVAKTHRISVEWVNEKQADLVIVGGGTIIGVDSMCIYERLKNIKTPMIFFGSGFRREKRNISKENIRKMKELFKKATLKGVRGYLSQQFLIHIGIEDSEVIGDPSITFKPIKVERLTGKFKVGICIRSMGKTGELQYTDNQTNFINIANICDYLIEQYQATLYFFNLTENVHDSDSEGIDEAISKMRYKGNHTIIPFERNTEEIFSLLAQMDYIVSQRLHPTIIGWIQGIPHIALEYQFGKTDDFMQSIGMGEFVIRTDEFNIEIYKKKLILLLKEKETIISHAKESVDYWSKKQEDFANRCLNLII